MIWGTGGNREKIKFNNVSGLLTVFSAGEFPGDPACMEHNNIQLTSKNYTIYISGGKLHLSIGRNKQM